MSVRRLRNQESFFCPTCQGYTEQERGRSRGERFCSACGSTFTLTESRTAHAAFTNSAEGKQVAELVQRAREARIYD